MNFFEQLLDNYTLWAAVLAWAVAQIIKMIIEFSRSHKIDASLIFSTGGMPSSHCSFVTAASTVIGFSEGFNSSAFAIAAIISMIVMVDASGVRRAAGKQAAVINQMVENIENSGIILDKKLKELLGHSPVEVACGAVLGIIIGIVCS